MHQNLRARIDALPDGHVLDPLRTRWPELAGRITYSDHFFLLGSRTYRVYSYFRSHEDDASSIAAEVDGLFQGLGFGPYVKNKEVQKGVYILELTELIGE